jgi:hypothetical protein
MGVSKAVGLRGLWSRIVVWPEQIAMCEPSRSGCQSVAALKRKVSNDLRDLATKSVAETLRPRSDLCARAANGDWHKDAEKGPSKEAEIVLHKR